MADKGRVVGEGADKGEYTRDKLCLITRHTSQHEHVK